MNVLTKSFPLSINSEETAFGIRVSTPGGGNISPEGASTSTVSDSDQGFYLLKKDSERRRTLVHVLSSDSTAIIDLWMKELKSSSHEPLILSYNHLQHLLAGLKDFIPNEDKTSLVNCIYRIKEECDFDPSVFPQIQSALLIVQYSISTVLRGHSIKPHWMFALDNLIRAAVQAAITILSPELGHNLAGGSIREEPESPSIAGDMTPVGLQPLSQKSLLSRTYEKISMSSPAGGDSFASDGDIAQEVQLKESYKRIKAENIKLWQELLTSEQTIQLLLKNNLESARMQIQYLQSHPISSTLLNSSNVPSASPAAMTSTAQEGVFLHPLPRITVDSNSEVNRNNNNNRPRVNSIDLRSWLSQFVPDETSMNTIVNNFVSRQELLSIASRDALKDIGLNPSVEQSVWTAIMNHRRSATGLPLNVFNHDK